MPPMRQTAPSTRPWPSTHFLLDVLSSQGLARGPEAQVQHGRRDPMSPGLIFHADVTPTIDRVEAWLAKEAPNSGQGHDHELWASCVLAEEGYTLPETLVALLRAVKSWRRPDHNARTTITSGWKRGRDQGRLGKGGPTSDESNQTD